MTKRTASLTFSVLLGALVTGAGCGSECGTGAAEKMEYVCDYSETKLRIISDELTLPETFPLAATCGNSGPYCQPGPDFFFQADWRPGESGIAGETPKWDRYYINLSLGLSTANTPGTYTRTTIPRAGNIYGYISGNSVIDLFPESATIIVTRNDAEGFRGSLDLQLVTEDGQRLSVVGDVVTSNCGMRPVPAC